MLPSNIACRNPINVRGDAPPARFAAAVEAALSDPNVDAVLVLHVPRPVLGATDAARAVADVARRSPKPVLAAWLGAIERAEAAGALEAGGIANFYTPENAIDAFSFLAAYRHHQEWLLEVPPPQPEPHAPDLGPVERLRTDAIAARRSALTGMETHFLLSTFSLPVAPAKSADTLAEALAVARRLGYPVTLRTSTTEVRPVTFSRDLLRDGRMLTRAWAAMIGSPAKQRRREAVIVVKEHVFGVCGSLAIGLSTDAVFGPVITFGAEGAGHGDDVAVLLPPLNERLARDTIRSSGRLAALPGADADAIDAATEALAQVLVQLSALACAVPWVRTVRLEPVRVGGGRVEITGARVVIDPAVGPRGPGLRPHGDPPVSRGARGRCHASRRRAAARAPDPSGGCRNRARVRLRPVGRDALLPLLLPAARAHAVDARALHAGGLRPRDGARGRRRSAEERRRS